MRKRPPRRNEDGYSSVSHRKRVKGERHKQEDQREPRAPRRWSVRAASGESQSPHHSCEREQNPCPLKPLIFCHIGFSRFEKIHPCEQWIATARVPPISAVLRLAFYRLCGVWTIRKLKRITIDNSVIEQPQRWRGCHDQNKFHNCSARAGKCEHFLSAVVA